MNMNKKKRGNETEETVAPTVNEEDSYGEDATEDEIVNDDSTRVTRLMNEYPSGE